MRNRPQLLRFTRISLMAVVIAACAWVAVPAAVPFTLQTFGIFCTLGLLGGADGFRAIGLYLLLGAVGLPVFSGGGSGLGWLFGMTGGYLLGFLLTAPVYSLTQRLLGRSLWAAAAGMAAGLLTCYLFGSLWFALVYTREHGGITLPAVFSLCVIPYLLPDAAKLILAVLLVRRIKPILDRSEGGKTK